MSCELAASALRLARDADMADVPVDFRCQFSSSTHTLATVLDGKGRAAGFVIEGGWWVGCSEKCSW
jgi:hypothetical protein